MIPLFYNYPIYVPIFTRGTDNSKKKKPIQKEKKKKNPDGIYLLIFVSIGL